jgi:5'-3' exonuclease
MTNTAILDGDILAYRAAFWADSEGGEWLESRVLDDLKRWTPPGITKIVVALSCRRSDNFRRDWLPQYKEHRNDRPTPDNLPDALQCIRDNSDVVEYERLEADDLMGIEKSALRAVCVTIDKDLQQVPGYWWYPPVDPDTPVGEINYTTVEEADFWFHRQWITGDSTDNIPGLWKMGPKKAEALLNQTHRKNHTALVLSLYEKRKNKQGDSYTYEDALAMMRAVRILRDGEISHPWLPLDEQ